MSEKYQDMTVAELKALLKEQELKVSGNKSLLIERLNEHFAEAEEAESEEHSEDEEVEQQSIEESEEDSEDFEEDLDEEDDFDDDFDDEDWDDEELEFHVAKQKPVLDEATKAALALRAAQKKATPVFRRTEWFRYKRLSRSGWRRPKGMDNKQRRNYKYRGAMVRVGHGKVAAARGLHSSGFSEGMVHVSRDEQRHIAFGVKALADAAREGGLKL